MKKIYLGAALAAIAVCVMATATVFAQDECDPGKVTGGGFITQTDYEGNLLLKASFAGNIKYDKNMVPKGNWQVKLDDVWGTQFDNANFKATEIKYLRFFNWNPFWCGEAAPPETDFNGAEFVMAGTLNGEEGWTMMVRMTDYGEAGKDNDTIRLSLFKPYAGYYDTAFGFMNGPWDRWCTGLRTRIDGGNLQIHPGTCQMPE